MRAKTTALALAAVAALYLVALGQRGWILLGSGSVAGALLGVGVLAVPVLVAWAIVRELWFGQATERMARQLEAEGGLPVDDLPRTPAGRVDRAAADAAFTSYRAQTDQAPDDWRTWYRLACAYDAAGDRSRARAAMRHAGALHRVASRVR